MQNHYLITNLKTKKKAYATTKQEVIELIKVNRSSLRSFKGLQVVKTYLVEELKQNKWV